MLRFHPSRFGSLLVLTLGLWAVMVQAQEYRYRYISLDAVEFPEGFDFFDPIAINNSGQIYGTVFGESVLPHVAVYADGVLTALQSGIFNAVNQGGTIGGSVLIDPEGGIIGDSVPIDPENFIEIHQAALFHGNQVELIPRQPGESRSFVGRLNDSGVALVFSYDDSDNESQVLYKNGQTTVLDFGPTVANPSRLAINNQGIISGTQGLSLCNGATGFRFDTRTGATTLLSPLSTEPAAWGVDINNRGNVLGYSLVCGGIERIGVWNRHGGFQTYFVEGIEPNPPTISNRLLFNDNNLIVITRVSSPDSERSKNSYLVPKPGVRLNLADLVENLPVGRNLSIIQSLNNHGDMIGFDIINEVSFLLERIGEGG